MIIWTRLWTILRSDWSIKIFFVLIGSDKSSFGLGCDHLRSDWSITFFFVLIGQHQSSFGLHYDHLIFVMIVQIIITSFWLVQTIYLCSDLSTRFVRNVVNMSSRDVVFSTLFVHDLLTPKYFSYNDNGIVQHFSRLTRSFSRLAWSFQDLHEVHLNFMMMELVVFGRWYHCCK